MKLNDWITTVAKISLAEFAGRLGVSRQAITRYCAGERMPDAEMVERIVKATDGAVTVADLHEVRLAYLKAHPTPAPEVAA